MKTMEKGTCSATGSLKTSPISNFDTPIIPQSVPKGKYSPRHWARIDKNAYNEQPNSAKMGSITNQIKYRTWPKEYPLQDILYKFGTGHCATLGYSVAEPDPRKPGKLNLKFVHGRLMAIDLDDVEMKFTPEDLQNVIGYMCAGLFYTFSHGKEGKGNRYRLLFQFDHDIVGGDLFKAIAHVLIEDLKRLGIKADDQAITPHIPIRGGKNGHVLFDERTTLNTARYMERAKEWSERNSYKSRNKIVKEKEAMFHFGRISFEILKEMAETIGIFPRHADHYEEWMQAAYGLKHYVESGYIDDDQGFELFEIISGDEQDYDKLQADWDGFEPNGKVTIGSFIHLATQAGYNKHWYFLQPTAPHEQEKWEEMPATKDGYLPAFLVELLVNGNDKTLMHSPTGSGKTTAVMKAFEKVAARRKESSVESGNPDYRYYLMALPTISLTEQTAYNNDTLDVRGSKEDLDKEILNRVKAGERVFSVTYDKVQQLVNIIRREIPQMEYVLVVDEIHKWATDYSYRSRALKQLRRVSKGAVAFIGLTGTPEEVLKSDFNRFIKITGAREASPCKDFKVYTYSYLEDEEFKTEKMLAGFLEILKEWVRDSRVLAIVQNKEVIESIMKMLEGSGIYVAAISSEDRDSATYKQIVEEGTVPDDIQIILTTTVLADGISINNGEDSDWNKIVMANHKSQLFLPSTIKQFSNRFRQEYRTFAIYMKAWEEESEGVYNIDRSYKYHLAMAEQIEKEINSFPLFDRDEFLQSTVEKSLGINLSKDLGRHVEVDELHVRHLACQSMESYYKGHRKAFIRAVERLLRTACSEVIDTNQKLAGKGAGVSRSVTQLKVVKEMQELEEERMLASVEQHFTKELFDELKTTYNQDSIFQGLEGTIHDIHIDCLKYSLPYVNEYETMLKIVRRVMKTGQRHACIKDIKAVLENELYNSSVYSNNKTQEVRRVLLTYKGETLSTSEMDGVYERIAKKLGVTAKIVENTAKQVLHIEKTRENRQRFKKIVGPKDIAYVQGNYQLSEKEVSDIARNVIMDDINKYQPIAKNFELRIFKLSF